MIALDTACGAVQEPSAEPARIEDAGTPVDAAPVPDNRGHEDSARPMLDAAQRAPAVPETPQCNGQVLNPDRRMIVLAGAELLTNYTEGSAEVRETRFHGKVTETGSGFPADVDRTVADVSSDDLDGWKFLRVDNDAGDSWTILARNLGDVSFGVVTDAVVDVRLRHATYPFAPMVLELLVLEDAAPAFYYGNVGEVFHLMPPAGVGVAMGPVECMETGAECFPKIEFYSLRVIVPGKLSATLGTNESTQLGDYLVKHYASAQSGNSTCPDAFVAHVELAVARSL